MGGKKAKRRGGTRDDSKVHISYTRNQLTDMLIAIESSIGVGVIHSNQSKSADMHIGSIKDDVYSRFR